MTEGELPWGVRLLLVLLLKKEPRLPRLFRPCSPADAPGLCAAPDDNIYVNRCVDEDKPRENDDGELIPVRDTCLEQRKNLEAQSYMIAYLVKQWIVMFPSSS